MNIEFFYFLICMQIPRLYLHWNDSRSVKKNPAYRIVITFLIEIALIFPLLSMDSILILVTLLVIFHGLQFIKVADSQAILKRIIEFVFLVISGSFIFGVWNEILVFNDVSISFAELIIKNNALLHTPETNRSLKRLVLYIFGVVTLVNEINNVIRYILDLVKTVPMASKSKVDDQELYRGKIIGVTERILFFFFVITDNYASIAFILTAKAFTRYKELDNKNFAEYVLIGTLLSSALSIFWAFYITELVKLL